MINYYEVLQIDPKADQAVIRAAYRTLMKELHNHPDHGGSTETAQRINEAYSNLIDPLKRRIADRRIRQWYGGSEHRTDSNAQAVKYIRCGGCGATNRIMLNKLRDDTMVQCGVCRCVLLCDRPHHAHSARNPLDKLIARLTSDKWTQTGQCDHYFDAVLQNDFFLKNFLYLKKTQVLTRENTGDVVQVCKNTYRRHLAPVGHYFILVADRIEHISYVIETLKRGCEEMNGWSSGVIIPVDCSRKQVFMSHVNLNRHPADIMKLREYLFH
ncbi:MAG: J domain-containing protein [Candidatus Auribacterota bacterium]|nr:J domain-containing protein [Candidatus Auribacterota bacterium]